MRLRASRRGRRPKRERGDRPDRRLGIRRGLDLQRTDRRADAGHTSLERPALRRPPHHAALRGRRRPCRARRAARSGGTPPDLPGLATGAARDGTIAPVPRPRVRPWKARTSPCPIAILVTTIGVRGRPRPAGGARHDGPEGHRRLRTRFRHVELRRVAARRRLGASGGARGRPRRRSRAPCSSRSEKPHAGVLRPRGGRASTSTARPGG